MSKTNLKVKVLDFVQLGGAYPTLYLSGFSTPSDVPFSLTTCSVGNQQKWHTLRPERSGVLWRSCKLPECHVVLSSPFNGLSLYLPSAL